MLSEKWNYNFKAKSIQGELKPDDFQLLKNKYANFKIEGLPELEKNENELRILEKAQVAFDLALAEIGLPSIKFPLDEIHIISDEEYRKKFEVTVKHNGEMVTGVPSGIFWGGNVYMARKEDGLDESALLHELTHKASYYEIDCFVFEKKIDIKASVIMTRMGIKNFTGKEKEFEYLDEAITELFSQRVIDLYNEKSVAKSNVYDEGIKVFKELIRVTSQGDDEKEKELLGEAFRNYFQGDYSFLEKIEKVKRGSTEVLRGMGERISPREAAKSLGLDIVQ